jgi:uncharacterized protein (TIRG00374 family)
MREEVAAARRSGSAWKLALRLGVTVALLAVLLYKAPSPSEILPDDHLQTFALLFAALVATFLGVVLSAWRWQRVLQLFDARVGLTQLTRTYLAGMFVGNVLPSTIGGDVLRVTRASNSIGSTTDAFGSVVLERLTGFVALPLLVVAGFALRPSLLDAPHAWIALLVAGITVAVLAILLFVAGHPKIAGRFAGHQNWTRFIGAVHRGVDRLRKDPRQLVPVIGTAVLYQISIVVMYGLIFRALDMPVPLFGLLAFAPAVLMLQVLPISLGGLGVREGALVLFLHSFLSAHGLPDSRAIAAGLLWYALTLIVSVLGAPAFAVGQRKRPETVESTST